MDIADPDQRSDRGETMVSRAGLSRASGENGSSLSEPQAVRARPPISPLRLGIAARMAFAAAMAGCLWLAVFWAIS